MANLRPVKRKDLIAKLKQLGFVGPYSGGKHQFMIKNKLRLTLPISSKRYPNKSAE